MADILLYGDTERNAALRHEIPIAIGDPFLYAELRGRPYIMASSLERERLARARPDAELVSEEDLGFHELLRSGLPSHEVEIELVSRAAKAIGVGDAIVEFEFPLGVAERLRSDGIKLTVEDEPIKARRRVKSSSELAGIRRAQRAAEAGMAAAAGLLRRAQAAGGQLSVDGEPLLAESVRTALRSAAGRHGAMVPPEVIVASVWQGSGHDPGLGLLPADRPIQIDLWPQDEASGCWADMTRTFLVGEPSEEIVRQERLVKEALKRVRAAVRPGITGRELHALSCEVFEREGYLTQRTGPGEDSSEGFQFSLGHGVGLRVHEDPALGLTGHSPLLAGDVLAVEPGLWNRAVGGVRLEDLLLVTDDGCETLTQYPYDLRP